MDQLQNPFWQFSVSIYGEEKVAAECIALQDTLSIDVNCLLYCAWLGAQRSRVLTDTQCELIEATVTDWRRDVVVPLRSVRRALKKWVKFGASEEKLRTAVASNEQLAEKIEQYRLYQLTNTLGEFEDGASQAVATRANVTTFLKKHTPDPEAAHAAEALISAAVAYSSGGDIYRRTGSIFPHG